MVGCSIQNCKSKSMKGGPIRFFSIPRRESVAKEWLRYCGPKTTTKNGRVCSNHFVPSDYMEILQHILLNEFPRKGRQLKPDAVPTLLLSGESNKKTPCEPIEVHSKIEDVSSNMNIHSRPEDIDDGKFRKQLKKVAVPCIYKVIKVTKDGQPKFIVQNMESQGLKLVKVKRDSEPVEMTDDPLSDEDEAISYDGEHNISDDQTNVPLTAHPVPLSDEPDPLCDVKVKVEKNQTGDGKVVEGHRIVEGDSLLKGKPVRVMRAPDGRTLRVPQPPTADLFQTRRTEEKIQKITQQRERARASLHNVRKTLRRRNAKVAELQAQVATLKKFLAEHHGNEVVEELLRSAKSTGLKKEICSVKKDERMKEANRQLLTIERDDRQKSPDGRQESPDDRQKSPKGRQKSPKGRQKSPKGQQKSSNIGKKILQSTSSKRQKSIRGTITNKSDIQQKAPVDSKPAFIIVKKIRRPQKSTGEIGINKNSLLLKEHVNPENLFGTQPTFEVRRKSDVKTESVDPKIGNKRISDIRQNEDLRRVVIHPHLVVQQENSSDMPQIGDERKSDIQLNDKLRRVVIHPNQVFRQEIPSDIPHNPQIGNKRKSEIGQNGELKRLVIYPNHVVRQEKSSDIPQDPQIGDRRKLDIRQNDGKRRVVIHPHQVVRQEKSSDISQSLSLQPGLVIQIDGMQNSVIPRKLVRLEDNNIDMG